MSTPRPGSASTSGFRPRWRATARWLSKDGSPNSSGITVGGASATPLVPRREREGVKTADAGRAAAAARAWISSAVTSGTSPGMVRKTCAPARAACCWARATAAVWPRFSGSPRTLAPSARTMADTSSSRVITHRASSRAAAAARSTSRSIARASAIRSSGASALISRCLALTRSLTGTAHTIMSPPRRAPRSRARPRGRGRS